MSRDQGDEKVQFLSTDEMRRRFNFSPSGGLGRFKLSPPGGMRRRFSFSPSGG